MGEKKRFKKVYIEITNVCNLSCEFCIKTTRKKEFLTLEKFKHIIKEVTPYTDHIYLHVMGEPLLHAQLDKILEVSAQNGLNVNITTNGFLINEQINVLLCGKPRKISFSLHSYGGNNSDNNFYDYLKNILLAIDKLKKSVICELRFWNGGDKPTQNGAMLEIIEKHFALDCKIVLETLGQGVKIENNVYIGYEAQFEWPTIQNSHCSINKFCYGLKDQMAILVDGTVTPCCLDSNGDINLGNIYSTSLVDILQSTRASDIIQGFSKNIASETLCQHCDFLENKKTT